MRSFIFITAEGQTFQPDSESIEPDIENCQVVGFASGNDPLHAFTRLVADNPYLIETSFDELICLELKYADYMANRTYFHLDDCRKKAGQTCPLSSSPNNRPY
jgi:hypothetical protein